MMKRINLRNVAAAGICILTMSIGTNTVLAESEITDGSLMHAIDMSDFEVVDDEITDSYGNVYSENVLMFDASYNSYVSFDLHGEYESFSGAFVASTETGSGAVMDAAIFADGKQVYALSDFTKQMPQQEFEIDLTGVGRLDIKTENTGDFPYGWLFMVEPQFTKAFAPATITEWKSLRDVFIIDSGDYEAQKSLKKDSYGELHDGAICIDASYEGYVLFNLNGQFSTLSGAFVSGDDTGSGVEMGVRMYCDDEEVFAKNGITRQMPGEEFELDVTGVKVLKIETTNEGDFSYGRLYLVDDILK